MTDDAWTVRLDARVKPLVEEIARAEEREPAQVVRRLVNSALACHPINRKDRSDN
jgi:hypothetical protein